MLRVGGIVLGTENRGGRIEDRGWTCEERGEKSEERDAQIRSTTRQRAPQAHRLRPVGPPSRDDELWPLLHSPPLPRPPLRRRIPGVLRPGMFRISRAEVFAHLLIR